MCSVPGLAYYNVLNGRSLKGRGGCQCCDLLTVRIWIFRSLLQAKVVTSEESDVEEAVQNVEKVGFKSRRQAMASGLAYCLSSCCMILLNKLVLANYDFEAGISLLIYQVPPLPLLLIGVLS